MANQLLKIGFIGGGRMAQALAKGFIRAGITKAENVIASCHPSDSVSANEIKNLGLKSVLENGPVVKNSDVIFISVKPSAVPSALADIKNEPGIKADKLFLSIAMGVSIEQLEKSLPEEARIMRVMPNTPVLVRNGTSVYVSGSKATSDDVAIARNLLEAVGTCDEVIESYLDAITALSGSGPAYVYVFIEALADGGVKMGLPRDLAYRLASQTVLGAGQMVRDTKLHPGVLKDNVTSPAGSTATGLHFLETNGFRAAVIGAIEAATNRCREVSSHK